MMSAAAFKRQIRSPPGSLGGQSQPGDQSEGFADVSPLAVRKRSPLPGTPQGLAPGGGGVGMQRVPSAPTYGSGPPDQGSGWQPQPRSTSAGNGPGDDGVGHQRYPDAGGAQDEDFDYISAYVNNSPRQGGFEPAGLR